AVAEDRRSDAQAAPKERAGAVRPRSRRSCAEAVVAVGVGRRVGIGDRSDPSLVVVGEGGGLGVGLDRGGAAGGVVGVLLDDGAVDRDVEQLVRLVVGVGLGDGVDGAREAVAVVVVGVGGVVGEAGLFFLGELVYLVVSV